MPRSLESTSRPRSPAALAPVRRYVHHLRTEGATPGREAAAVGLGVFVGCSPWYGFHLAICWGLGWVLRLNRLKMYLAANVSNPLAAPFLILAELQTGAWLRRGIPHALTLDAVRSTNPWVFGADILVGSVVVGVVLGGLAAVATWLSTRAGDRDPRFASLVRRAADRYVATGIIAWEFARGKLRGDPLYRAVVSESLLPSGGVLVDVGCGQGLMLAILAEAAEERRRGSWSGPVLPPVFDRLVGIETRRRVARLAQRALGDDADIIAGDARIHAPAGCRAVLFFDVLHMMPAADQERLFGTMAAVLEPGGVILVREADAGAGWRFRTVLAGNRLKAILFGKWRQPFHFRSAGEWTRLFAGAGFHVQTRETGAGTPFANVLFVLSRPASGSA